MPNLLLPARSRSYGNNGGGGGEGRRIGDRAWYGDAAPVLHARRHRRRSWSPAWRWSPSPQPAGSRRRARQNDAVSAEGDAALAQRRFGLTKVALSALPTFAYERKGADPEAGNADMCSVCLEDVQAGDMVRRLPSCRHLFHAECVDMWLHSHRTCPVCRCNLSPPQKVPGKAAETTETEPAAHEAVSPV
jgi:hypothetical protein